MSNKYLFSIKFQGITIVIEQKINEIYF